MELNIRRVASKKFKSIVMYFASLALVLGSFTFAAPQFFGQVAHAADTTTTSITSDPTNPSNINQAYLVGVSVARSGSVGQPSGSVTISDGTGGNCTISSLTTSGGTGTSTGYCEITSTTSGVKTLTATYVGDLNFNGSSGTASHTVNADTTNPTLTSVHIQSNNTFSSSWAKVGDIVTLSFTASEVIQSPIVTISGHSVTATNGTGNNWSSSYTMVSGDEERYIPFTIDYQDISGNSGVQIQNTTDSTRVRFDKTAPTCGSPTITGISGNFKVTGATIYYNNLGDPSAGSYKATGTAFDSWGLLKVGFNTTTSTPTDDVSGTSYEGIYNWDAGDTFDGTATITCYDNPGNTANTTYTVHRDITPPIVSSVGLNNKYFVKDGDTISIDSTVIETGSGISSCHAYWSNDNILGSDTYLDNLGTDCDGDITVPAGSGTFYLLIASSSLGLGDNVNNFQTLGLASAAITVDNTKPIISNVLPASSTLINNITNSSDVSYTLDEALSSGTITITQDPTDHSPDDTASPHVCTLIGTALNAGVHSNLDLSDTTNGCTVAQTLQSGAIYSFDFNATDLAGNVADTVTSMLVKFDSTAPVVEITSPISAQPVKGDYKITFTDDDKTSPQCSIDNTNWVACTSGATTLSNLTDFNALSDGAFTLYLKDTDGAGNTGTDSETGIIKDTVGPTLTITGATNDDTDMAGDLANGYVLDTLNNSTTEHLLQFKSTTSANELLANDYFGLLLVDSTVSPTELKAYYTARGVPSPFIEYLNNAADGSSPFVYINGNIVKLVDAARHDLLGDADTDMAVPDDFPLGTYTVSGYISDVAGNQTLVTLKLVVAGDRVAPTLTVTGFTADGIDMPGNLTDGYTLNTNNDSSKEYLLQFKTGTLADETLANEYFGLKLISSTVSAADLKAYYDDRGTPEPFLTYLKDAVDGTKPFAYINGNTEKLVDAARHDILGGADTDIAIPGNYPLGTYVVEGVIKDLAGNETTVTYKLIIAGDRVGPTLTVTGFTADSVSMSGNLTDGYTLNSDNDPSHEFLIQFDPATSADETLASTHFGLYLTNATVSDTDLKAYYDNRGTPDPYLTYLKDAVDGNQPFALINGSTLELVDAARYTYQSVDTNMAVPGDYPLGTYTLSGQIQDLAGNSTTVTYKLIVAGDRIAPAAPNAPDLQAGSDTGYLNTDNITNDRTPTFDISGLESGSFVTLFANGTSIGSFTTPLGASTYSYTVPNVNRMNEGSYEMAVIQSDNAGNISSLSSVMAPNLVIDITLPSIPSLDSPVDGAHINDTTPTLDWDGVIDATSYRFQVCSNDPDADGNCTKVRVRDVTNSQATIGSALPGTSGTDYWWRVRAIDAAGNLSDWSLANQFTLDTIAPSISISNPNTDPAQSKTITASVSDGTLNRFINGVGETTCGSSLTFVPYADITFTSESDNDRTVCYRAVDAANNTSYLLSSVIAGIDRTSPVITLNGSAYITLNAGDTYTDPGAKTDDGSKVIISGSVNTSVPGIYTINYSATDAAGNDAKIVNRTVEVKEEALLVSLTTTGTTGTVGGEVLGDNTKKDDQEQETDKDGEVKGTSDTKKEDANKEDNTIEFMGIPWYWWLIILAALGAFGWWIFGTLRRHGEGE